MVFFYRIYIYIGDEAIFPIYFVLYLVAVVLVVYGGDAVVVGTILCKIRFGCLQDKINCVFPFRFMRSA